MLDVDICKVVIDLASLCLAQLASVSFHSSVVTDLYCLLLVCPKKKHGFDLHLCGAVTLSPVNNSYCSSGSPCHRPKLVRLLVFSDL